MSIKYYYKFDEDNSEPNKFFFYIKLKTTNSSIYEINVYYITVVGNKSRDGIVIKVFTDSIYYTETKIKKEKNV